MRGELVCGIGVRRRGDGRRGWKVMKLELGFPTVGSELNLAVVSGGANVVDGDVVGGDEAREV